jgi:hypothetical protein
MRHWITSFQLLNRTPNMGAVAQTANVAMPRTARR